MIRKKTFGLKTLFTITAIVGLTIVAVPFVQKLYCRSLATSYAINNDPCRFCDVLEYGRRKGFGDEWIDSALRQAAIRGDAYYIRMVGPIDRRIFGDWTPMMYASYTGNFTGVLEFLKNRADPTLASRNDEDAADIAKRYNHDNVARLIELSKLPSWQIVLEREKLIYELRNEYIWDSENLAAAMEQPKYKPLQELLIEIPATPDEVVWFRVSDAICLAPHRNYGLKWMLDGKRIKGTHSPHTWW